MKNETGKITTKTVIDKYYSLYLNMFKVAPVLRRDTMGKKTSLIKKMFEEMGEEETIEYFEKVFKHWQKIKSRIKTLYGNPTIEVIWGFRFSFMDIINQSNSVKYEKKNKTDKKIGKDKESKVTKRNNIKELFLR